MVNLDFLCMQTAQEMVDGKGSATDKENIATKALGVLIANGPYALILFLETSDKKEIAKGYQKKLIKLCGSDDNTIKKYLSQPIPKEKEFSFENITKWLTGLAKDIDKYLFVKRLWQQTLTYARYHSKTLDDKKEPVENKS